MDGLKSSVSERESRASVSFVLTHSSSPYLSLHRELARKRRLGLSLNPFFHSRSNSAPNPSSQFDNNDSGRNSLSEFVRRAKEENHNDRSLKLDSKGSKNKAEKNKAENLKSIIKPNEKEEEKEESRKENILQLSYDREMDELENEEQDVERDFSKVKSDLLNRSDWSGVGFSKERSGVKIPKKKKRTKKVKGEDQDLDDNDDDDGKKEKRHSSLPSDDIFIRNGDLEAGFPFGEGEEKIPSAIQDQEMQVQVQSEDRISIDNEIQISELDQSLKDSSISGKSIMVEQQEGDITMEGEKSSSHLDSEVQKGRSSFSDQPQSPSIEKKKEKPKVMTSSTFFVDPPSVSYLADKLLMNTGRNESDQASGRGSPPLAHTESRSINDVDDEEVDDEALALEADRLDKDRRTKRRRMNG